MLRHYVNLFKRNILKYKFSFFINMVGLSTALACATLIYLWVNDELLTDKFHEKDDQIFHLMEFYVNSITYFGWESNYLSIRPTRF